MYKHGIEVEEKATSYVRPLATQYGAQVVIGTAPVNLAEDSRAAVNKPIMVSSWDEATNKLGFSDDWESYTLCQSMVASFQMFRVYPVIFINVLDPEKHKRDNEAADHAPVNHQVILGTGILKDSVVVKETAEGEAKELDKDYILTYDGSGRLIVTLLSTGSLYSSESINIASSSLDPSAVTEADIIGSRNEETGEETGLEAIRQVYPRFGVVPGLIAAPGWSHKPNVGAALMGKCTELNGVYRCECVLDLDTAAKKYTECKTAKDEAGYGDAHSIVLWPMVSYEGKKMYYSAVYAAMASYYTAINGDVPYIYPSNKLLGIDGAILKDGTEVILDQVQAAELNGAGIVTILNDQGWKSWGNNTGAYPENTDPKDRWIGCRRMFSFVANYFILQYRSRLDESMNRNTIDDIVNSFNIWGNSLVSQGRCAGIYIEYNRDENPEEDLLEGRLKVKIYVAPYTPLEYILAVEEFDINTLNAAIAGEEEAV